MIARTGLLALTMFSLASAPASATNPDPRVDDERAVQLYEQAVGLLGSKHRWAEAASLLKRSSAARSDADPEAFRTMRFAGRVYAQAGELGKAREAFTEAAELALARGSLVEAAHAYIDAAHAASERGEADRAYALAEKAQRISTSPLLPEAERVSIATLAGAL